jgi:hypothetical protein
MSIIERVELVHTCWTCNCRLGLLLTPELTTMSPELAVIGSEASNGEM